MPEKQPEATPVRDIIKFFGLNYSPPKGAIECLRGALAIIPCIRNGFKKIMSLSAPKTAKR